MTAGTAKVFIDTAHDAALPDLEPLIALDDIQKPYPMDAMPPIMRDAVCTYQQYGQQPISLVACAALAAASLTTQGLVNIARDSHLIGPLSLNIAVIAESGERKTSADRRMARAIRQWTEQYLTDHADEVKTAKGQIAAYEAERDGLLAKIKAASGGKSSGKLPDMAELKSRLEALDRNAPVEPIMPTLFYEDNSPEALAQYIASGWPSSSLWSDEGGLVIGGHGMGDDSMMRSLALLNRMWDGNPFERRRTTAKSFVVKGRRLTCSIMMQHVVLCRLLDASGGASRGLGFLARFLLAWPESTMGSRLYRDINIDGPEMLSWDRRLTELLSLPLPTEGENMALNPPVIALSAAAKREWITFHDSVEKELGRLGEFGDVSDFAAKTAENATRLAGILWTFQHGTAGEIDIGTMQAGAAIASWHLGEAKRILGATTMPQAVADAMLLIHWMQQTGRNEVSPRDILNKGASRLRKKERRDAAAKLLLEKHQLFESNQSGGTIWKLHPQLAGGNHVKP